VSGFPEIWKARPAINPYHHSLSSVKKWGGNPEDYLPIHSWFDESKAHLADVRHRALRHHSEGIFLCERIFGPTITNSAGRVIPTRYVGEQHVKEDCGFIPTVADWLRHLDLQPWMLRVAVKESDIDAVKPKRRLSRARPKANESAKRNGRA
jgi:hypothetical protein